MERVVKFVNKYGIMIHSMSILFWIWMLYNVFDRAQNEALPISKKVSVFFVIILLIVSFFNLYNSIKRRK